jgi:ABC-2 type transport system permease protein
MSAPPITNPSGGAQPVISRIADLTYRNYDGELRSHAVRWWVVALATIRANITKGRAGYWIPAALIVLVFIWRAILFYVTKNVRDNAGMMGNILMPADLNPFAAEMYGAFAAINILVFSAALTVGSASIAADNRANALLVYLSKPLTRTDYLIGKWMGVFLPLAALTVIPSLIMYLFFLVVYIGEGFLKENGLLIFKILFAALLLPALQTSIILGISAYSRSARMTGAIYAAFYFILLPLTGIVGEVVRDQDTKAERKETTALVHHLSVLGVAQGINMTVFDVEPQDFARRSNQGRRRGRKEKEPAVTPEPTDQRNQTPVRPPILPLALIGAGLLVLPVAAAYRKIRAVEVISG